MHIKINRQKFLNAIRIVEKTIKENKIKPVLSCVYANIEENKLNLCGTDLETTIKTFVEIDEVFEKGSIAFHYSIIEEYLRELKDEFVTLKVENDSLLFIETSNSVSEFSVSSTENYPSVFNDKNLRDENLKFEIGKNELIDIFEKLIISVATPDNIAMNCIRLESAMKHLHFISTDTYRLTYLMKNINKDIENFAVSIPADPINSMIKILKTSDDELMKVYQEQGHIFFVYKDITIITKLIELRFPPYQSILINNEYDKKLLIESDRLLGLLKRVLIFSRSNIDSKYSATYEFKESEMSISSLNDIAKINETMSVDFKGEQLKICLNVKYLIDFIQNIPKDKKIEMEFMHSSSAVKVSEEGRDDYIYIIMPLALRD